ncbi:hypothetical protein K460DRAFT_297649, partial [Cucurbitaria berberidis CBS 394.84]
KFNNLLNSAIYTTFRILLHSSLILELKNPLLKVVIIMYFLMLIAITKSFYSILLAGRAC